MGVIMSYFKSKQDSTVALNTSKCNCIVEISDLKLKLTELQHEYAIISRLNLQVCTDIADNIHMRRCLALEYYRRELELEKGLIKIPEQNLQDCYNPGQGMDCIDGK